MGFLERLLSQGAHLSGKSPSMPPGKSPNQLLVQSPGKSQGKLTAKPFGALGTGTHLQTKRELTLAAWERYTEWPLVLAALLFLATYAIPIIWPHLDFRILEFDTRIFIIIWAVFLFDYLMRFSLANHKLAFFRHNLIDFFSVILPVIRPLRILRVLAVLATFNRIGFGTIRRQVMAYTAGLVTLITFISALAVTNAERGAAGSNINSFGDGLWWAFVTLSTVGYGDMSPVTVTGRAIGVALMISGVLLLGVIAATLASWLVQHSQMETALAAESEIAEKAETDSLVVETVTLDSLQAQLTSLTNQIAVLNTALNLATAQPNNVGVFANGAEVQQ